MSSESTEVTPHGSEDSIASKSDQQAEQAQPSEEKENLPYTRSSYVEQLLQYADTIYEQQREIDEGRDQLNYLLKQMSDVLKEKAKLYRQIQEVRIAVKDKKKLAISMTRKEIKARFDKSDQMLKKTENHTENIKTTVENNLAVCGKIRKEVVELENDNKNMSEILCSSVTESAKEKIVELNERIEGFHKLTDDEYVEKINQMDKRIEELTIKADEKAEREKIEAEKYLKRLEESKKNINKKAKKNSPSPAKRSSTVNKSPKVASRAVNVNEDSKSPIRRRSSSSSRSQNRKPFKKPSLDPELFNFPKRTKNEDSDSYSDEFDNNKKNQIRNRTVPQTARVKKTEDNKNSLNVPQTTRNRRSSPRNINNTVKDRDALVETPKTTSNKKRRSSSNGRLSSSRTSNSNSSRNKRKNNNTRKQAPIIPIEEEIDEGSLVNALPPDSPHSPKIGPDSPRGSLVLFKRKSPKPAPPLSLNDELKKNEEEKQKKEEKQNMKEELPSSKRRVVSNNRKRSPKKTGKMSKTNQQAEVVDRSASLNVSESSEFSNALGKFNESDNFSFDNDDFDPFKPTLNKKVAHLSDSDSLDLEKMPRNEVDTIRKLEKKIKNYGSSSSNVQLLFEKVTK